MKLRTKRRLLNYGRLYNYQLATVLNAAFEEFKADFIQEGESVSDSQEALKKLGNSYRYFKKFSLRFVITR
ncbi:MULTISPECIES: hypothetical protein [Undibacterium]|uniref:Uncharacterized protein n=2 Tax=Undibacterium TaxID=401469 RepID=A0A850QE07_9BURK|nr:MULTISPECIES: hypothetical protein [Undibacterium]MBC3869823.1 hypothetical protein [Undibacterium oligocarboniphilum]MBC3885332.1 hypothetical protein [Undibacterium griseum]NVO77439.1 hypothetical protein [Undibacterium oligocarboniphilum]